MMAMVERESGLSSSRSSSAGNSHDGSWETANPNKSASKASSASDYGTLFEDVDLTSGFHTFHAEGVEVWNTLDSIPAYGCGVGDKNMEKSARTAEGELGDEDTTTMRQDRPFRQWIQSLRRRAAYRHPVASIDNLIRDRPHPSDNEIEAMRRYGHRKSASSSSSAFITAVKSASISLGSVSVIARSRRNTGRSSRYARTDRSSRASMSGARLSDESSRLDIAIDDQGVTERSMQRRRILEELISTEESYIGDIRFLMSIYITILAAMPTLPLGLRTSINRNLTEMVELHEEILGGLHRAIPHSEYTQPTDIPVPPTKPSQMHRPRGLGVVPENVSGFQWLQAIPGMTAEPQVGAEVAKLFSKKISRFFIYEEYGTKYEMMARDIGSAHGAMPQWEMYQKGLETLASSIDTIDSTCDESKKALTIGDLLVKPIQRICKYPLLFSELLKYTPVCDCPNSHMEIENALDRLREATAEINRVTDHPGMKTVLARTWLLQDRLVFPSQRLDAVSRNRVRSFGHIHMCGVLHVCWQAKEGVIGQYIICLLYRDFLCLASASRADQIYTIHACVGLQNIRVEEADNGRGLQCHTAPFSWKLVFECDYELYELIMTACTPKERSEWRMRLDRSKLKETSEHGDLVVFSSLSLNIKSLGTVFGKPGTIARRISIHRATTVGPKSPLCQVIVKNTSMMKDLASFPSGSGSGYGSGSVYSINRSQSLLATHRIPVLTPARGERARLEALLADVWSRDVLPFPGMVLKVRGEHSVRASASSMIRKLSVASITSSFTKRSASLASMQKLTGEDGSGNSETPDGSTAELAAAAELALIPLTGDERREATGSSTSSVPAAAPPLQADGSSWATSSAIVKPPVVHDGPERQSMTTPPPPSPPPHPPIRPLPSILAGGGVASPTMRSFSVPERGTERLREDELCVDEGSGTPPLRTSSANSLQLGTVAASAAAPRLTTVSSPASLKSTTTRRSVGGANSAPTGLLEKENLCSHGPCQQQQQQSGGGKITRGRSIRWNRVGGGPRRQPRSVRGNNMAQGIRSFFR